MRNIGQVRVSKFTSPNDRCRRQTYTRSHTWIAHLRLGQIQSIHPLLHPSILLGLIYTHRLTVKSLYLSLCDRQNHSESPIHDLRTFLFICIRLISILLSFSKLKLWTVNCSTCSVWFNEADKCSLCYSSSLSISIRLERNSITNRNQ